MKSLLLALASIGLLVPYGMKARAAIPAEPISQADELALDNYFFEVGQRATNPEALADHPLAVTQALDVVSGQTLLQQSWGTLAWSSTLGNVEIWQDNEAATLSYYIDENGRPAFAGEGLQGIIDVMGSLVYLEVSTAAETYFWLGQIVTSIDSNGQSQTSLTFAATMQCVCKGSAQGCPAIDCTNAQPCTYTNFGGSHNSICKWFMMPEQPVEEWIEH